MKRLMISALTAGLMLSSAAIAEPSQPRPQKSDSSVETGPGQRVICRKEQLTGSRLSKKERCLTAQEWAEKKQFDRLDIDRIQSVRYPHNVDGQGMVIPTGR